MNLFTMAEAANNYSAAGAGKTKLPVSKMLLLGILAGCGNTKSGSSKGMEEITILYPGDEADRFTEFLNNEFAERMKNDLNMKFNVVFVPWDQ